MCVCVCVCVRVRVCVFVFVCVCKEKGTELTFGGGGSNFSAGGGGLPPYPPSRESSAIPETKLGHKTQQNYNILNYKMYWKSVIIHNNRILPDF